MKLAIVTSHPIQYYAPLFRELAQRLELHVFYMHRATAQDQALSGFGVGFQWDVDLLSGYSSIFLDNVARQPGSNHFRGMDVPGVRAVLQQGKFDAVLVTGWYLKGYLQTILAAKRLGIHVMVRGDSHLDTPRSLLKRVAKRLTYPLFLRLFDAALVVGKRNREYLEYYGYPCARMFDAPHCVDNGFFAERSTSEAGEAIRSRLGIPSKSKVVLFAGKLVPFKRPLDVVEAVAVVRKNGIDAQVLVAGSGQLDEVLRERAKELNIPIHMLGFCNQTEIPAAYAAADVLILPSNGRETWGLVVNEALASGTSVIVSDAVGCAPDLAADGHFGRTYPVGNTNALSNAIMSTLGNPVSRIENRSAVQDYSLENAAVAIQSALLFLKKRV